MRLSPAGKSQQQRYTVAALVYFLYGLFYLFGAQYLTNMQATERAMSNPRLFFALGALLVALLPPLIYSRFALALSLVLEATDPEEDTLHRLHSASWVPGDHARYRPDPRQTVSEDPLHTVALIVAVINATCLIWAGVSRPVWVTREAVES